MESGAEVRGEKSDARPAGPIGPSPEPLLLRAPQAAASCNTSARTWRAWDAAGKIPRAVRIGRSTYWRPEELKAWIAAGCPDRKLWETIRQ
jgi:predicted DNA-binding transcriptional regulator AlpA